MKVISKKNNLFYDYSFFLKINHEILIYEKQIPILLFLKIPIKATFAISNRNSRPFSPDLGNPPHKLKANISKTI